MPTVHLLIKGKVQGVFYRATAKDVAKELGLTGWVKNTKEGNVEALASGSAEQLQQFINWCRQGPAKAIVTNVEINFFEEQAFNDFKIIR
ncbi:MAG: acylphosphatase [Flavisolibacter sp.]